MKRPGLVLLGADAAILSFDDAAGTLINPASATALSAISETLPGTAKVSAILITNFGSGHADLSKLPAWISRKTPVILPEGCAPEAREAGFEDTREMGEGGFTEACVMRIAAVPAAPADGRFSAIITCSGLTVFFAGKTLFEPLIARSAKQYKKIDLAVLPVGGPAMSPGPAKKTMMSAQEAAGLCTILSPAMAVPMLYENDPTAVAAFRAALKIFSPATKTGVPKTGEYFPF